MKKTALLTFVFLLVGGSLLFAGGSSDKQAKSANTQALKVWILKTWSDKTNQMLFDRAVQFGKEQGMSVKAEFINSSDISQKFNAAMESGQMPDVTFCMPFYFKTLAGRNLLLDLTDTLREIQDKNGKLFKNTVDFGVVGGKNFAVPLYNETRVLFYREDLLKAAGISAPPKTFEELRATAKALTDPAKGVYGFGDAFALTDDCENNSRTYLWSWGGAEYAPDKKSVTVNSSETKKMVQFFVDMMRKDKSMPESSTSWDDSGNNQSYISGQSAMVINTPTILAALNASGLEKIKSNTKIAPIPVGPVKEINYGNGVFYVAWSGTKNPEGAKNLLKYIMDIGWYSNWIESTAPVQTPTYEALAANAFWKTYPQNVAIASVPIGRYLGYPGSLESINCDAYTTRCLGTMWQDIFVKNMPVDDAIAKWEKSLQNLIK